MKVLIVSNQYLNGAGVGNPIIHRIHSKTTKDNRVESCEFIPFTNKISDFIKIRKSSKNFDIVHVHFGGLYALLVYLALIGIKAKKIITFHGTDIHAKIIKSTKSGLKKIKIRLNQWASFISIILYKKSGFVASEMIEYLPKCIANKYRNKFFIQKLGVDYDIFRLEDKSHSKNSLNLNINKRYVLFSDVSNTSIKRRDIAQSIVSLLDNYQLLVMSGVRPDIVPVYINSCDFLLLTSDEEGSPNIIREALVMNKPVFSVDVGDASKQLVNLSNSAIISREPNEAAGKIKEMISKNYTDNTREKLKNKLSLEATISKIIDLYSEMLFGSTI